MPKKDIILNLPGYSIVKVTGNNPVYIQVNYNRVVRCICEKQQSGVVLTLLRNPNNRKEKDTSQGRKVVSLWFVSTEPHKIPTMVFEGLG
ncbi:hypothetical protein [Legionella fallonii]|uniref:Uncharacterized protein n=1 Tax=Legionella fallonii LLAP-10 TaxID=1212491 RepID=A0A098G817_9GAMM|nr:hypothetical protein [Legionella fallonii]CEG58612.1 protein of unknown function [Legionella fallonii LLAP-10]